LEALKEQLAQLSEIAQRALLPEMDEELPLWEDEEEVEPAPQEAKKTEEAKEEKVRDLLYRNNGEVTRAGSCLSTSPAPALGAALAAQHQGAEDQWHPPGHRLGGGAGQPGGGTTTDRLLRGGVHRFHRVALRRWTLQGLLGAYRWAQVANGLGLAVGDRADSDLALGAWRGVEEMLASLGIEYRELIVHHDRDPVYTGYRWTAQLLV